MIVAISGATGFIGRRLTEYLESKNMEVIALQRSDFNSDKLFEKIDGSDYVINLAGESIFQRWTKPCKRRILSSRVDTTRQIVESINRSKGHKILISTSAVGYYADDVVCDEYKYSQGRGFLAEVCRAWEAEALRCNNAHRTVITRFGVVLDSGGGALSKMVGSIKLGVAAVVGDGNQPFSWIALDDLLRAIEHLILNANCKGIYNLTAPMPTTNLAMTSELVSKRSSYITLRVPKFIFKMVMGESSALLTNGQYVLPARLVQDGFVFNYKTIQDYIHDISSEPHSAHEN